MTLNLVFFRVRVKGCDLEKLLRGAAALEDLEALATASEAAKAPKEAAAALGSEASEGPLKARE